MVEVATNGRLKVALAKIRNILEKAERNLDYVIISVEEEKRVLEKGVDFIRELAGAMIPDEDEDRVLLDEEEDE